MKDGNARINGDQGIYVRRGSRVNPPVQAEDRTTTPDPAAEEDPDGWLRCRWWHYCHPGCFFTIANHGLERQGIGRLDEHTNEFIGGSVEPPFSVNGACFSSCDTWDPLGSWDLMDESTGKIPHDAVADILYHVGVVVRYEVLPHVLTHSWLDFVRLVKMTEPERKQFEVPARQAGGDPRRWRMSLTPVPVSQIVSIEAWYGVPGSPWERAGGLDQDGVNLWFDAKLYDTLRAFARTVYPDL